MTTIRLFLSMLAAGLLSAACGGGAPKPSGGETTTAVSGIAAPQEISALPTKTTTATTAGRLTASPSRLALAADSDYEQATTVKRVNEPALGCRRTTSSSPRTSRRRWS